VDVESCCLQLCRPASVLRVAAEDAAVSTDVGTAEAAPCPTALGIDEIQELIKYAAHV
jgi:hypothetical protein